MVLIHEIVVAGHAEWFVIESILPGAAGLTYDAVEARGLKRDLKEQMRSTQYSIKRISFTHGLAACAVVMLVLWLSLFGSGLLAHADDSSASDENGGSASTFSTRVAGSTIAALGAEYDAAVEAYEAALAHQEENANRIVQIEADTAEAEEQLGMSEERLKAAAVEMYKNAVIPGDLIEAMLSCDSLSESIKLYDYQAKLETARRNQYLEARTTRDELQAHLVALENERKTIEEEVDSTRQAVADAKDALRKAAHLDGEEYHQVQKNGVNCGATAFIVGVNIMLGEERYKDNEKVWASDAFGHDSTTALAQKGSAWLEDNDLDDVLSFEEVRGDITQADELREELEAGNVVVISSGSGSEWVRVDAAEPQKGLYPDGHWIVFYGYLDGIFYANDSAVSAKKGAGCPYTEEQMQQWLDGRSTHFACVLSKAE